MATSVSISAPAGNIDRYVKIVENMDLKEGGGGELTDKCLALQKAAFLLLSISSKLGWKFSDFSAKMFRSGIIFSKISLCYLIRVGGEFTCANGQCISIFKRCNRSICVMLIKAVYQPYINHLY